jgi:hypothetical protein
VPYLIKTHYKFFKNKIKIKMNSIILILFLMQITFSQECVNDDSVIDPYGDTCTSYYDFNDDECGDYDNDDFIAAELCCVCGGGCTMGANDQPCQNGASVGGDVSDNSCVCNCATGFSGTNCETNIDDCVNKCQNGTCIDGIGDYTCNCAPGYFGQSNCEPCGSGKYNDQTGQNSCKSCQDGKWTKLKTGQSTCVVILDRVCGTGTKVVNNTCVIATNTTEECDALKNIYNKNSCNTCK